MPRLTPEKLCLANLRNEFPSTAIGFMTLQDAQRELIRLTGQDFGLDAALWSEWLQTHPPKLPPTKITIADAKRLARQMKPTQ